MDHKVIGCKGVNWIKLAQDRVRWAEFCEHSNKYLGSITTANFLTSQITTDHSIKSLYHTVTNF